MEGKVRELLNGAPDAKAYPVTLRRLLPAHRLRYRQALDAYAKERGRGLLEGRPVQDRLVRCDCGHADVLRSQMHRRLFGE